MTTPTKLIFAGIAVLSVMGALAFFGLTPFGKAVVQQFGSPTGSTFGSAKIAEVTSAPLSLTSTSTSLLNSDSSDRIVDSGFVSCATSSGSVMSATGGVATWNWLFATSTVANQGLQGNTFYMFNINVATSTTDNEYQASSSAPVNVFDRLWPAGTYLNILTNATSTNQTLKCQEGVYYHGS